MLLAVLYRDDLVIAAAPACDQYPYGNHYWTEVHPLGLSEFDFDSAAGKELQTSYISIAQPKLRSRLLAASIDDSIDLIELTQDMEASVRPSYLGRTAA